MNNRTWISFLSSALTVGGLAGCVHAQTAAPGATKIPLNAQMLKSESEVADFSTLVDEQSAIGDPPASEAKTSFVVPSQHWRNNATHAVTLDLGKEQHLASAWFYDTNGVGTISISAGQPDAWKHITNFETSRYLQWGEVPLNTTTRYLRLEFKSGSANVNELALTAYSEEAFRQLQAKQAAEALARAEREAALRKAQEEVAKRPVIELAPFGKLSLVDEVDVGAANPGHMFEESPKGASRVENILGRPTRVLAPTEGEAAYMSFRLGQFKLLKPGAQYVVTVEYPEDAPRTYVVMNGGNETSRGFHTGRTTGDAFHPKYVNNLNESLNIPLSGRFETWKLYFSLHDRFPERGFIRGEGARALTPEDGFPVTIAQYSARDIPVSKGAAVSKIRLYEVLEPAKLNATYTLPPAGLPRRHLFWREEMADGVISGKTEQTRGVVNRLDWYRNKARLMHFLGMNTFSKDLLEFGAVQHWDTSPLGGNKWAYFDSSTKDLWGQIVELMGKEGFDVMPYYEYSGSKGQEGLGHQRRAKPLGRDDAYTHIKWIESANVDITDPEAYEDFRKMLDLTVIRQAKAAKFVGIWIRPRSQMPISFADATRERFAKEANNGTAVTRDQLKQDGALLKRYYAWWFVKRREFFTAMRDYLAENGIEKPLVLYTAEASEPGVSFASWEGRIVTDDVDFWKEIVSRPEHLKDGKVGINPISVNDVVQQDMYYEGLFAPKLNWGGWELNHANPESDPGRYKDTQGVLLTHAFNRLYTVASPKTLDAFEGPAGLALIRHYTLNENMMFDRNDKEKLGYFVGDMERTGPYSMLAEVRAMANGNPTHIGYLSGGNFGRGFPEYARAFNTAFLSLPALPSRIVPNAAPDKEVVVREIRTQGQGTWYAVMNIGLTEKKNVKIKLPGKGQVQDAATKQVVGNGEEVTVSFNPCELKAWWRPN